MRVTLKIPALVLLATAAQFASPAQASIVTYQTLVNNGGDGPKQGQATITLGTGTITIVLESLGQNPTGAGQEVSGVIVNFASALTANAAFSSNPTATAVTIGGGGSFTQSPNTDITTGGYTWGV